jgi:hypothetical protein
MIGVPLAHVGGIPIEETVGSLGPALFIGLGVVAAKLRARLHRVRAQAGAHPSHLTQERGAMRPGRAE